MEVASQALCLRRSSSPIGLLSSSLPLCRVTGGLGSQQTEYSQVLAMLTPSCPILAQRKIFSLDGKEMGKITPIDSTLVSLQCLPSFFSSPLSRSSLEILNTYSAYQIGCKKEPRIKSPRSSGKRNIGTWPIITIFHIFQQPVYIFPANLWRRVFNAILWVKTLPRSKLANHGCWTELWSWAMSLGDVPNCNQARWWLWGL